MFIFLCETRVGLCAPQNSGASLKGGAGKVVIPAEAGIQNITIIV
jgi:hypothetical protein